MGSAGGKFLSTVFLCIVLTAVAPVNFAFDDGRVDGFGQR